MPLRPRTEHCLAALDKETEKLFRYLEEIPSERLKVKPNPEAWSALEALNHIYLSEKGSLQYIRHKLTKPQTILKKGPDAWFRSLLLKWGLFSPFKFKAPPQTDMRHNQPVLGLAELRQVWERLREELREFLEEHEKEFRNRLPYRHPVAGRLTFQQMLTFFLDHQAHHKQQIISILKHVKA